MIIHTFLYDPGFLNTASIIDAVRKTGGICVPSSQSLSYFVQAEEFPDERVSRSGGLNVPMTSKPRLIIDQTEFSSFVNDVQVVWSETERQNLFTLLDRLCFAYNPNETTQQVELSLTSAVPQYVPASYVYSTTKTAGTVYTVTPASNITCPDYVTFSYVIANTTQYQIRVWLNNAIFYAEYPLSTVAAVIPPLPLAELYTLNIANGSANAFTTALASSQASQQALQSYIQSNEYSGYYAADVSFIDNSGDSTVVQFNLLYNGCAPGSIAVRTAIRTFLLDSGVGTSTGWQALAPSLFVTERFYLLAMWDQSTSLVNSVIYPNITLVTKASTDATTVMYDIASGFVTANYALMTTFYDRLTLIAVPDPSNNPVRLSLAAEHPTYQDVPTTDIAFATMTPTTQEFATLLATALSIAMGNTSTNGSLTTYTAPNDNRTYVVFTVVDVEYFVVLRSSYLTLV